MNNCIFFNATISSWCLLNNKGEFENTSGMAEIYLKRMPKCVWHRLIETERLCVCNEIRIFFNYILAFCVFVFSAMVVFFFNCDSLTYWIRVVCHFMQTRYKKIIIIRQIYMNFFLNWKTYNLTVSVQKCEDTCWCHPDGNLDWAKKNRPWYSFYTDRFCH